LRRLRKFVLWVVGITAVVVLVAIVGRWEVGREGERRLTVTTQRLDADDPGWKFDAVFEPRHAPEPKGAETVAALIPELADGIPEDWRKWHNSEASTSFRGRATNYLPPQRAIDGAREFAPGTRILRVDAIRLRDRPSGSFPLTIPADPMALTLPHLDKCRQVVGLLRYDAYLAAAAEKNPDRGISAARAALAVARAIGDEPLLVSQLVRIACATIAAETAMQVLAWSVPTEGLAELQAELLAEADAGHFRIGVRGERAAIDRLFRGFEDGTIPAEHWFAYVNIRNPGPEHYAAFKAYRALLPGDHTKALELMTRYVEASRLPPHELLAAVKEIPLPAGPPEEYRYVLTRNVTPAFQKIVQGALRCRADLLAAATGIACERFRQKTGRWPRDLNELVPEFLPAVPLNPFDGNPLGYRTFADRIAVFAFWANSPLGTDDGDFHQGDAPGHGIGYRVWVPTQRGLPEPQGQDQKAEGKPPP
jgi:hypothetical protein